MGQPAIAITDHGRVAGGIELIQACQKNEIKPIIGSEIYVSTTDETTDKAAHGGDNFHLTLLARNRKGFENLARITSHAYIEGFHYKPRISLKDVERFKWGEGIICLTGCIGAQVPYLIMHDQMREAMALVMRYRKIFDDVYIELMYHGEHQGVDHTRVEEDDGTILIDESQLNDALKTISDASGVPLVATNDAHYLHERHGVHHDTLICKGKGKFDPDRKFRFPGAEYDHYPFYVKDGDEMREAGDSRWDWEDACNITVDIARSVEMDVIPLDRNIIPAFKVPPREEW